MKKLIKKISAAFLAATISLAISAQDLRTGYFLESSAFRHQINPALLDHPYLSTLFGQINVGATGNVGLKDFVYKTSGNANYDLTTFMSPTISADEFLNNLHDKNHLNVSLNYNLASVAFKAFAGMNVVEMNLRSYSAVCLPYELFDFMKQAGAKEHYTLKNLGARSKSYLELAFGHSHALDDNWTIGVKTKLLFGLAYADLDVNTMDITMNSNQWIINTDAKINAAILSSKFKYSDRQDSKNTKEGKQKVNGLDDVSFGIPGFGLAMDLGAVYKMPAAEGLTLSASLTDLGFITWSKNNTAASEGSYTFDGFNNPIYVNGHNDGTNKLSDQADALKDDLEKMFSVYDEGQKSKTTALAATFNLGAEYVMPFYKKLSVGFLLTDRFDGLYSWHQAMLSANVRPLSWLDCSLNTALSSTGFTCGGMMSLHAPHFNFYIGADHFIGQVSKQYIPLNNMNSNLCLGITFPL